MSLAGAIESLRSVTSVTPAEGRALPNNPFPINEVTSVTSPKNQTLPENPLKINEVTPVTSVTSQKTKSQREAVEGEGRENSGQGEISPNGEVSKSFFLRYQRYQGTALTEPDLAALVTREAHRAKLAPADLWAFLSLEDIEAIGKGSPDELNALRAFAESRSRTGDRTTGGHTLPFPAVAEPAKPKPVRCGDCAHFERDRIGDGHGIGRCQADVETLEPPMYPGVLRLCRGFVDRACREGADVGME